MIFQLRTCFRTAAFFILISISTWAATVAGRVELKDSREPAVRKHSDFSGVVLSLTPLTRVSPPAPSRRAIMIQKNKVFSPHVLAISAGTSVEFPNDDRIYHNAFSNYNGQLFDLGLYPPGKAPSLRFVREGVVRIFCNIHPSMSAVIVVLGTPFFTTTSQSGKFEITNVPEGDYELKVFAERATEHELGPLSRTVKVEQSRLDLPLITISESGYLPIPHKNKFGQDYPPAPDDDTGYPMITK